MLQSYKKKEKELEDMIETIKEEEKKKNTDARNEFSALYYVISGLGKKRKIRLMKKLII